MKAVDAKVWAIPALPQLEMQKAQQNRTLAQISQGGVYPPGHAPVAGRCTRLVKGYVEHYGNVRLNSAIGYIPPEGMLAGYQQEIQADRDRKLVAAREQRKNCRQRIA
jgi:hypothetical protein